jgi:hypothetical protein
MSSQPEPTLRTVDDPKLGGSDRAVFREMDEEVVADWAALAFKIRVADQIIRGVGFDPRKWSDANLDDQGYEWEKLSGWVRSYLMAASDHMNYWADQIVPLVPLPEKSSSFQQFRPNFTLARGGLEAAAQGLWVLLPAESGERVLRHLRLLHWDLSEEEKAIRVFSGDEKWDSPRKALLVTRAVDSGHPLKMLQANPGYLYVIQECAKELGGNAGLYDGLWRQASAAAHGKNWFSSTAYDQVIGEEYEPGHFRSIRYPRAQEITKIFEVALDLFWAGAKLYAARCGSDPEEAYLRAVLRVEAMTPVKPGQEEAAASLRAVFEERLANYS